MNSINPSNPSNSINSSNPINRRLLILLALCLVAMVLRVWVFTKYVPLGVDGGWGAYPALAMSRGGYAVENAEDLQNLRKIKGLAIHYGFDNRNIRLIPMTMWFKVFGGGHYSCRIYSLVEYLFLVAAMFLFLLRFAANKGLVILVFCLYLMDGSTIGMTADLRPDLMITLLTLVGFTFFHASQASIWDKNYILSIFALSGMALIWPYTAVPLSMVFIYFAVSHLIQKKSLKIKEIIPLIVFMIIPTAAFFLRNSFNDLVFGKFPFNADTWRIEITQLWSAGIKILLSKEVTRWSDYFINSNILLFLTILATFSIGVVYFFVYRKKPSNTFLPLFSAIAIGSLILLVADPHVTHFHLLCVAPFLFAIVLSVCSSEKIPYRLSERWLSGIVLLAIIVNMFFSLRTAIIAQRSGYDNTKVTNTLQSTMPKDGESVVIIGPTELFPQIMPKGNVTMLDNRSGSKLNQIDPYEFNYIIINKEYVNYRFEEKFRQRFPDVGLTKIHEIGNPKNRAGYLKILMINKRVATPQ